MAFQTGNFKIFNEIVSINCPKMVVALVFGQLSLFRPNHFLSAKGSGKRPESREGGTLVLFVVQGRAILRGTFSNGYGIMGIIFTIFRHFTELWVSFSGDFS